MSKLKNKNVQFGYLVFSIILIYLSIQFYNSKDFNIYIAILGMVILLLTIFKPDTLKLFTNLWIKLGLLLGRIIAPIVMAFIYFAILTPIGLVLKIFGKDLLRLRRVKNNKSYWLIRSDKIGSMDRQF